MKPRIAPAELDGQYYAERLSGHIRRLGGLYVRDETGTLNVILGDRRIRLDHSRENHGLAALMVEVCGQTTLSKASQVAIQRLQIEAMNNLSNMNIKHFSAMSEDARRLYVPTTSGELLAISAEGLSPTNNGFNDDFIWLEHPNGAAWEEADPNGGLELFEKLVVDTQSCAVPAMRWLVAMNEALFCLIRECTPARFITEHIGPSQSGKTTGAQRFTLLHGLGEVKGDYSVAALSNIGDIGLLVMDNKEQSNFTREYVDFLLFLATGAERGRCFSDGRMRPMSLGRPLGVITTIEGVVKSELQNRVVEVQYERKDRLLERASIEHDIKANRHKILSALALVLLYFFNIRGRNQSPIPLADFSEHFATLCDLLRAYGDMAIKPDGWSETIIEDWTRTISDKECDEDDLEYPIMRVIECFKRQVDRYEFAVEEVLYRGVRGTLYITEAHKLLRMLHELNLRDVTFPQNETGLGRRLRSAKFRPFEYLATDTDGIPALKRGTNRRPLGLFFPGEYDGMTPMRASSDTSCHS